MCKIMAVGVVSILLGAVAITGVANERDEKEPEPKSYTVAGKVVRRSLNFNFAEQKSVLETEEVKIPDLTALAGTLAEYHSGGKVGSEPYGFRLQLKIEPTTEKKIRLEVMAEDSIAREEAVNPFRSTIYTQRKSQRVVRQVALGGALKLVLEDKSQGETVWVELTVREANAT